MFMTHPFSILSISASITSWFVFETKAHSLAFVDESSVSPTHPGTAAVAVEAMVALSRLDVIF
jgi:hypothetical protein